MAGRVLASRHQHARTRTDMHTIRTPTDGLTNSREGWSAQLASLAPTKHTAVQFIIFGDCSKDRREVHCKKNYKWILEELQFLNILINFNM